MTTTQTNPSFPAGIHSGTSRSSGKVAFDVDAAGMRNDAAARLSMACGFGSGSNEEQSLEHGAWEGEV